MSLSDQRNEDIKEAMRARDEQALNSLRAVRGEIIKFEKSGDNKSVSDDDVITMVKRLVKQRQDSIEMFRKGEREDLVGAEEAQIEILQVLLPESLTPDELSALVAQAVESTGAESMKEMGQVMKAVRDLVAATGKDADNRALADLVKQSLG